MSLLMAVLTSVVFSAPVQSDATRLFEQGMTWEAFLDAADVRRDVWRTNAGRSDFSTRVVDRLKAAGAGLQILVVAEAACSDSVHTVPYIANLAAAAGVPLRVVRRDAGEPILARYRTPDDRGATPTVVLIRDGREVGAWVERPEALQTWFIDHGALSQRERVDRKMSWYEWDRGDSTVAEFVALAERSR